MLIRIRAWSLYLENEPKKVTAVILRDPEIRTALHLHLMKRRPQPIRILEEVGIHNGNAIADLVAFYGEMHCFEIKGATDNISRITRQGAYYNEAFPKISLVTTKNHLQWCTHHSPSFWGILLAYLENGIVKIRYIRPAKYNPFFCKKKALLMLWKDELSVIATSNQSISFKSRYTREDMAIELSKGLAKSDILDSIQRALLSRMRSNLIANESDVTS